MKTDTSRKRGGGGLGKVVHKVTEELFFMII